MDPTFSLTEVKDFVVGVAVKKRHEAVVVFLGKRVELVVMTLREGERGPKRAGGRGIDPVHQRLPARFRLIYSTRAADPRVSITAHTALVLAVRACLILSS